jgi:hypothetical protein
MICLCAKCTKGNGAVKAVPAWHVEDGGVDRLWSALGLSC